MVWKPVVTLHLGGGKFVSIHLPSVDGLEAYFPDGRAHTNSLFQSIYHQSMVWKLEAGHPVAADVAGFNPSTISRWSGSQRSDDISIHQIEFQSIYHQSMVWKPSPHLKVSRDGKLCAIYDTLMYIK